MEKATCTRCSSATEYAHLNRLSSEYSFADYNAGLHCKSCETSLEELEELLRSAPDEESKESAKEMLREFYSERVPA